MKLDRITKQKSKINSLRRTLEAIAELAENKEKRAYVERWIKKHEEVLERMTNEDN